MKAPNMCIACKGARALCGNERCPLLARVNVTPKLTGRIGTDFFGPSPSVFVGRIGYPNLYMGPLATFQEEENPELMDTPSSWMNMSYDKIVEMRSMLIRSKSVQNIFSKSRFIEENQELALAERPTDVELNFSREPTYKVSFSDVHQPMGPSAPLEKMKITENVKINRKVDRIVSDDLKANESVLNLYDIDVDVYKITTILSSGALGLEQNQKLVPTRWSITATDDMVAKNLIEQVKDFKSVSEFNVFEFEYLSNHFCILAMPGNWEFENFEAWAPGSFWSQGLKNTAITEEYESFEGRKKYATEQGGGYYAARLGVVEGLSELKRQARIVSFREIYEGYTVPLGVWVVREAARNAMRQLPVKFTTLKEALAHINSRMRIDTSDYFSKSRILRQKRLTEY
ncbi:MAG: Nre family DNA repair protein [archaeon]